MISLENEWFWHLYKNCLTMLAIWVKYLLPPALNGCPKCKKLPILVTLPQTSRRSLRIAADYSNEEIENVLSTYLLKCNWLLQAVWPDLANRFLPKWTQFANRSVGKISTFRLSDFWIWWQICRRLSFDSEAQRQILSFSMKKVRKSDRKKVENRTKGRPTPMHIAIVRPVKVNINVVINQRTLTY